MKTTNFSICRMSASIIFCTFTLFSIPLFAQPMNSDETVAVGVYPGCGGGFGRVVLFRNGSEIQGYWGDNPNYPLVGTLNNSVLTGTWGYGPTPSGPVQMTFNSDGSSFQGLWGYGTSTPTSVWNGSRDANQIGGVRIIPNTVYIAPGNQCSFKALVAAVNQSVLWSASDGNITGDMYTAPMTPGTYTVTAKSTLDVTKQATAMVYVNYNPNETIAIGVYPGCGGGFGRVVLFRNGSEIQGYWGDNPNYPLVGTLNNSVLTGTWGYGPTPSGPVQMTFTTDGSSFQGLWGYGTSTPTSAWNGSRDVNQIGGVRIIPGTVYLAPGNQCSFKALVAAVNQSVLWSASDGNITGDMYTAPMTPGIYTVDAKSTLDATKQATAMVHVTNQAVLSINGPAIVSEDKGPYLYTIVGADNITSFSWSVADLFGYTKLSVLKDSSRVNLRPELSGSATLSCEITKIDGSKIKLTKIIKVVPQIKVSGLFFPYRPTYYYANDPGYVVPIFMDCKATLRWNDDSGIHEQNVTNGEWISITPPFPVDLCDGFGSCSLTLTATNEAGDTVTINETMASCGHENCSNGIGNNANGSINQAPRNGITIGSSRIHYVLVDNDEVNYQWSSIGDGIIISEGNNDRKVKFYTNPFTQLDSNGYGKVDLECTFMTTPKWGNSSYCKSVCRIHILPKMDATITAPNSVAVGKWYDVEVPIAKEGWSGGWHGDYVVCWEIEGGVLWSNNTRTNKFAVTGQPGTKLTIKCTRFNWALDSASSTVEIPIN